MKLKGTKTAENLLKSFAGESQANRRYTYYAKVARKQGYIQIADIFEETADQESMHAKRFFSFLNEDKELQGEMLGITAEYPVALYEETLDNLKAAAAGENEEWTDAYQEFAKIDKAENKQKHVCDLFRYVSRYVLDSNHAELFQECSELLNRYVMYERNLKKEDRNQLFNIKDFNQVQAIEYLSALLIIFKRLDDRRVVHRQRKSKKSKVLKWPTKNELKKFREIKNDIFVAIKNEMEMQEAIDNFLEAYEIQSDEERNIFVDTKLILKTVRVLFGDKNAK